MRAGKNSGGPLVTYGKNSPVRSKVLAQLSQDSTSGRFPRRSPLGPVGRSDDYGVSHAVPAQQWSALGVAFAGARFIVSFDGAPLFEVVDTTFTGRGRVGLWTKADSVTSFDAFEISPR